MQEGNWHVRSRPRTNRSSAALRPVGRGADVEQEPPCRVPRSSGAIDRRQPAPGRPLRESASRPTPPGCSDSRSRLVSGTVTLIGSCPGPDRPHAPQLPLAGPVSDGSRPSALQSQPEHDVETAGADGSTVAWFAVLGLLIDRSLDQRDEIEGTLQAEAGDALSRVRPVVDRALGPVLLGLLLGVVRRDPGNRHRQPARKSDRAPGNARGFDLGGFFVGQTGSGAIQRFELPVGGLRQPPALSRPMAGGARLTGRCRRDAWRWPETSRCRRRTRELPRVPGQLRCSGTARCPGEGLHLDAIQGAFGTLGADAARPPLPHRARSPSYRCAATTETKLPTDCPRGSARRTALHPSLSNMCSSIPRRQVPEKPLSSTNTICG